MILEFADRLAKVVENTFFKDDKNYLLLNLEIVQLSLIMQWCRN